MDLKDILKNSSITYDLVASTYQETFDDELSKKKFDRDLLDKIASSLSKENGLILDIGCGSAGHIGRYLFNKDLNVCGIDISPKSIELAHKINPAMSFKVMNMLQLEFQTATVQAILAFYSIIHIPKIELINLFNEFARVLQPGGLLVLAVHEGFTEQVVEEMLGYKTTLFVDFFSEKELINYLTHTNFSIEYSHVRTPYEFEHQTNRIYIIANSLKK